LTGAKLKLTSAIPGSVLSLLRPSRLTGPIFDKELRISSRHRRNYALRSAYVALLAVFVTVVWLQFGSARWLGSSGLYSASRMAEAGKRIIITIVWFQFYAAQILAVFMLSTAINEEIYRGTLGTLMTTPITSLQIVMGKLLSKLFQIVLLLGVSLPLLAIVRIFGGVPWDFVFSSLCITLTAVIFAGSVSLFFSILSRRAYVVIIFTVLSMGALFWLLAGLIEVFGHPWGRGASAVALYPNPYMLLAFNTDVMISPRMAGRASVSLFVHCGVMLLASAGVLYVSFLLVRKIALAQAAGGAGVLTRLWWMRPKKAATKSKSSGQIRRVTGPPVMWKELITRRSSREKVFVITIIGTELIMIAAIFLFPYVAGAVGMEEAHATYVAILMGLGALSVTVFPATCIASEKEARSWPLLLTTTLDDWEIVLGKFIGVLRRSLPIWLILVVYLIPFWGIITFGVLEVAALVVGTTVFLCGTGLYVSSRAKKTNSAVAANFVMAASVWGILHFSLALFKRSLESFSFYRRSLIDCFVETIPFIPAMETVWSRRYDTPGTALLYLLSYIFVGIFFAWRAKCRFRRDVF
jgi:ABC-type transport system involved in multi-copper enzyme maturation permease subunit